MTQPQRTRFDVDTLDSNDPFEIDFGNTPHLYKHGLSMADLYDLWYGLPVYFPGIEAGAADWLLVGPVPGNTMLCAPLAPPNGGQYGRCRPIGLYRASVVLSMEYEDVMREGEDYGKEG